MTKIKAWVSAARLRTLPLSISGIIVGSSLGNNDFLNTKIFWFAIATTLGLQILSNFANDYGDGVKGTDNEDRVGPTRALQSGVISKKEMFRGIVITSIIALLFAITLIYVSFGAAHFLYSLVFFVLGITAIAAAIKYTVGKTAYGYRGLGDVFVFMFFGLVSVVGCYFLYTKTLNIFVVLPAITIGLLSTAVLNLNNMRDYESDKKSNKNTLVVKIGVSKSRKYHFSLIVVAMITILSFSILKYSSPINLLFLVAFIPLSIHLKKVKDTNDTKLLDPELKKVALTTFLLAILFSLGQIL
ncbi:1,4-dihydroxy-2-naphthoate octaprenyltransferase [Aquimarina sp. AD10]|uniref:1,4-dihydroxy-2-naphthoate octaprenyltransferase n=1 Tax=Aquimarina sp. AD10 TaxID=1714849 RepID=UPI000E4DE6CF|nr:1,4-dihydroxy-2-naphthoate octaprenyltransferase [Aquimarina sp. AD10]AXT59426.1 1,4-dihydroxy-2-naphthoate octaprenyltransferase [Aquimarina sp. AD10]RKN00328.1 1,4-dihydroxy-2-naphthoate octaprenyltransferase [Aquimarina sp. AD10]